VLLSYKQFLNSYIFTPSCNKLLNISHFYSPRSVKKFNRYLRHFCFSVLSEFHPEVIYLVLFKLLRTCTLITCDTVADVGQPISQHKKLEWNFITVWRKVWLHFVNKDILKWPLHRVLF